MLTPDSEPCFTGFMEIMPFLALGPATLRHWVTEGAKPAEGLALSPGTRVVCLCVHPGQGEMSSPHGNCRKKYERRSTQPHTWCCAPKSQTRETPEVHQREVLVTQTSPHSMMLRENQPNSMPLRGARHKGRLRTALNMEVYNRTLSLQ